MPVEVDRNSEDLAIDHGQDRNSEDLAVDHGQDRNSEDLAVDHGQANMRSPANLGIADKDGSEIVNFFTNGDQDFRPSKMFYPAFLHVQTVDFFYPLVDDPKLMGKIALANDVSDVYAIGTTEIDIRLHLL
ncbi:hypothetical protein GQX74_005520 [Glossina fuscipes]|nr:hypothetical protein GQX74_005520 [Glossina fuscipes]